MRPPSFNIWRFLARVAIYVALSIAALVGPYALQPAFSWVLHNWPWRQIPATALTVLTLVVLVLLIGVLIAHAVLLTRPFPRPKPTRLLQDYHRLGDLAAAIHSAIEAGRRG
jgi:prepilin signal peptidase PulO-like enzyme (type II secretory pathway)